MECLGLEREHLSADLPIFWYMYGAVVATSDTEAMFEDAGDGTTVRCSVTPSDIDASETAVRRGCEAVNRALNRYYDGVIEGLTDEMYDKAPYEVQRHYRRLDQQLEAAADEGQMTLDGDKNEKRTRETLYDFIEAFPEDEYPEFSDALSIWYRLMSAELDSDDYDPGRAQDLAENFWRLFCLELACRENNGLSREDIARELNGVSNVEDAKQRIRSDLRDVPARPVARRIGAVVRYGQHAVHQRRRPLRVLQLRRLQRSGDRRHRFGVRRRTLRPDPLEGPARTTEPRHQAPELRGRRDRQERSHEEVAREVMDDLCDEIETKARNMQAMIDRRVKRAPEREGDWADEKKRLRFINDRIDKEILCDAANMREMIQLSRVVTTDNNHMYSNRERIDAILGLTIVFIKDEFSEAKHPSSPETE